MLSEKMRVHILAKELNVPSKTIIEKCRAEGITVVKNHMSTLSAGLEATVREWFSEGAHETTVEISRRVDLEKIRAATARQQALQDSAREQAGDDQADATTAVADAPVLATQAEAVPASAAESEPPTVEDTTPGEVIGTTAESPLTEQAAAETQPPDAPPTDAPPTDIETDATAAAAEAQPDAEPTAAAEPEADQPDVPDEPEKRSPIAPAGPQHVPTPAKLQGPRVVRYETPDYDAMSPRRPPRKRPDATPSGPTTVPAPGGTESDRRRRRGGGRTGEPGRRAGEWGNRDLAERRERLAGATGRRIHRRRETRSGGAGQMAQSGPKTEATVHEPVMMKDFCAATGLSFIQLFKVLKNDHDMMANINMALPTDTAELLALHFGIELTVVPAKTKLDELKEEFANRERKNLQPRPPIVTMLGHVDHGKTSLLDAIRHTHVASREDGGITQHTGAYRVKTEHGSVTFLDTPGHEAFTAMRARGARVTDVVVLVVAADDGLMPQTIEAINHTKAAGVPIVVALNKIDLGDQNKLKIYGQLTEHGLTPSGDWGGDVDVIETSATTGRGVKELVDHLAALTAILEIKADPTLPATGTAIEAETKPGVGAVARVLIQEGTLRVGSFVVCGNAAGKVRALLDDRGERIEEAGPAMPIEIWGLDDVPSAGDRFYEVDNLQLAKGIGSAIKHERAGGKPPRLAQGQIARGTAAATRRRRGPGTECHHQGRCRRKRRSPAAGARQDPERRSPPDRPPRGGRRRQ